jgi:adenylate cyclase
LRFDYTAMGDSVNLAARLEGVNKAYGTKILLSESTATLLNNRILLRPVDRVRVKGKALPVNVFTPSKDAVLVAKTQLAWEAYLASNWKLASECWNEIRKFAPHDSLIEGFEARIQEYIATPPPADWDGSIALEKL